MLSLRQLFTYSSTNSIFTQYQRDVKGSEEVAPSDIEAIFAHWLDEVNGKRVVREIHMLRLSRRGWKRTHEYCDIPLTLLLAGVENRAIRNRAYPRLYCLRHS